MSAFLLDASSFVHLIRSSNEEMKAETLRDAKILDLTYYEVGNSIWKGAALTNSLSKTETLVLTEAMSKALEAPERIRPSPQDFPYILELALRERLTYYDASYVYVAKRDALTFITDDGKLSRIAKKHVKTMSVSGVIRGRSEGN